jgi:predicted O-methyltransferase YrrM
MIVPFPMDSINAARVLGWLKVQADFCYIDASHEEGDVLRDYEAYWPLIRSGGVMVADDISNHFPGVVKDWEKFLAEHKLKAIDVQGEKQAVSKP